MKKIGIILLVFSLFIEFAGALQSLYLRSLSDASVKKVVVHKRKDSVFIVFQKDCVACRKQVKDLSCLPPKTKVYLVGVFSSETDLRSEYRSFNSTFEGVYGDKDFMEKFQIKEVLTPQILIKSDESSKLFLGFQECSKILKQIRAGGRK